MNAIAAEPCPVPSAPRTFADARALGLAFEVESGRWRLTVLNAASAADAVRMAVWAGEMRGCPVPPGPVTVCRHLPSSRFGSSVVEEVGLFERDGSLIF